MHYSFFLISIFYAHGEQSVDCDISLPLFFQYIVADSNLFELELQEQNTVPSLRKALKDVAIEKDAAVVARVHLINFYCLFVFVFSYKLCISLYRFSPHELYTLVQEDLSAQLRMVKKRLKEAEEEQYRVWQLLSELNSKILLYLPMLIICLLLG